MLSLEELSADESLDTVIMAFTDMQGRLLGKRLHRDFFFEQVEHGHGTEGCNYLLALDMEMDPVPGYEIASWERGYGDFNLVPDPGTLRRIPWLEATALVLCEMTPGMRIRPGSSFVFSHTVHSCAWRAFADSTEIAPAFTRSTRSTMSASGMSVVCGPCHEPQHR